MSAAYGEADVTEKTIYEALTEFESTLPFKMTAEQREAVVGCVQSPVSVISGDAGKCKTTILLALLSIYNRLSSGLAQFQVALSGRAAQRMSESTGREAMTIAKLISNHIGDNKKPMPDHLLLVVDEASMVDLVSAYKLVGVHPYATRIVLVGDVAQLPPVGSGLIFHAAMDSDLPVFELTQVKRQGQDSGINLLATAVRISQFEDKLLNSLSGDITFINTSDTDDIVSTYHANSGADCCIVLTPPRKGSLGVDSINLLIQESFNSSNETHYMDEFRGLIPWITRKGSTLCLGDQVMVTANDYEADIRNGDLGSIYEVFEEPRDDGYGVLQIEGKNIPITLKVLQNLDLGYGITIHKSLGSRWNTCILLLPSYAKHMIDQTLLYTAITRAAKKLIIIGDKSLINAAINRCSIALIRKKILKICINSIELKQL